LTLALDPRLHGGGVSFGWDEGYSQQAAGVAAS
jgi:hypothetical protein